MLVVIIANILVCNQDAGTESLVDESQYGELPEQLLSKLLFGEAVAGKLRAQPGSGTAESLLPKLVQHRIGVGAGSPLVPAVGDLIANDALLDQPVGGFV